MDGNALPPNVGPFPVDNLLYQLSGSERPELQRFASALAVCRGCDDRCPGLFSCAKVSRYVCRGQRAVAVA